MFLHLSVSHSVHGGGGGVSASVHAGIPLPGADTPPCAVQAGRYGQQAGKCFQISITNNKKFVLVSKDSWLHPVLKNKRWIMITQAWDHTLSHTKIAS